MARLPCELWMKFREIEVNPGYDTPLAGGFEMWRPPETKRAFEVKNDTKWMRWTHGNLEMPGSRPANIECNDTTSMFWCPRRQAFLQATYDCTRDNLSDVNTEDKWHDWGALTFERPKLNDTEARYSSNLWCIGHRLRELRIPGPLTESWKDLLGPTYFTSQAGQHNTIPCQFAGSLSILLGLLALAVAWEELENMLRNCFQPACEDTRYRPSWLFSSPGDKTTRRGIVIEVGFDKTRYTEEKVKRWESGKLGPILTSDDAAFKKKRSPVQSAQHPSAPQIASQAWMSPADHTTRGAYPNNQSRGNYQPYCSYQQ